MLYSLGGSGGGLTCFVDDGYLCYEYNCFILMRTKLRSAERLPAGPATIEVTTTYVEPRPAGPLNIAMAVNGIEVVSGVVPVSVPLLFTANDCLDIGISLGAPVSLDYFDRAPFPFEGRIENVNVRYIS